MRVAFASGLALAALATTARAAPPGPSLPGPSTRPFDPVANEPLLDFVDRRDSGPAFAQSVRKAAALSPLAGGAAALVDEALGAGREVRGALRPRIDVDVGAQQAISRAFSNDPATVLERSRPERRVDATLSAEQTLLDFGAGLNRLRAARARGEAARAQAADTVEDVALTAVTAWYDLYLADADAALATALVARHEAILLDTRRRLDAGAGSLADLARVSTYVAAARARAERATSAAAAARLRFRAAFAFEAPARVGRPSAPPSPSGSTIATIDSTPSVIAANARVDAADRDLSAARADRRPRLVMGLDAQKYSLTDEVIDHDVRARLTLRQRLYGGGASAGRVDQAAARRAGASFALDRARDEAVRDLGLAQADARSLEREAAILREAYIASRRTRDAYAEGFRIARGTLLELLRAEVDLEGSAAAYVRAVAVADVARYALLRRTGGLLAHFAIDPPQGAAR